MVGLAEFIRFENDTQAIFEEAIAQLPPKGIWTSERNVRLTRGRDIDMTLKRDGELYAIVEIKASSVPSVYRSAKVVTRQLAESLNCPYYFVVSPDHFGFFRADAETICDKNGKISAEIVVQLLSDTKTPEFRGENWIRSLDTIIRDIRAIHDEQIEIKRDNIIKALEVLKNEKMYNADPNSLHIVIDKGAEESLYKALLGKYVKDEVCRFTSLSSIFRTLNDSKQSMCSLVAMNDKSETSYVSEYVQRTDPSLSGAVNRGPYDWNFSYITSCCDEEREHDFTMYRLYAADAQGVSIRYKIDNPEKYPDFILSPVSYQRQDNTHPELDVLISILQINVGGYIPVLPSLSIWQHFFKPKEYEFEKEVRLLYKNRNTSPKNLIKQVDIKWILNTDYNIITPIITFDITKAGNQYPLILKSVNLGPKMHEADINRAQIEFLLSNKDLITDNKISVNISSITHYR